jgi:hypothetical protein
VKPGEPAVCLAVLPHPGPLPLGEGGTNSVLGLNGRASFDLSGRVVFGLSERAILDVNGRSIRAGDGRSGSLSQRERAGVREKVWKNPSAHHSHSHA